MKNKMCFTLCVCVCVCVRVCRLNESPNRELYCSKRVVSKILLIYIKLSTIQFHTVIQFQPVPDTLLPCQRQMQKT